jgi:fructuronate reductase
VTERSEAGSPLVISDPGAGALSGRMRAEEEAGDIVRAALAHTTVFGEAPWPQALVARLSRHLATLQRGGVDQLLSETVTEKSPTRPPT